MVLDLESEDAGDLIGALSSETARDIVLALHTEPATLSEVADAVGTSRQNAQYHIKQLAEVGAVRIVDTVFSEKGREMKVYAPSGEPLIIVSGDQGQGARLSEAISRLFGPVLLIGVISMVVQLVADWRRQAGAYSSGVENDGQFLSEEGISLDSVEANVGLADGEAVELDEALRIDLAEVGQTALEAYPGLVFFVGAITALVLVTAWRHRTTSFDR